MLTIEFPKLNTALVKPKELQELNVDNPRRGVLVIERTAIIIQDDFVLCFDLYEHFTVAKGITDDQEKKDLEKILFFMNGKIFSNEFWKELVGGATMSLHNGNLKLESPKYSKDLHYKVVDVDFLEPIEELIRAKNKDTAPTPATSISFPILKILWDALPKGVREDNIIFEFTGIDSLARFTFGRNRYVYGFVRTDFATAAEGFKFEDLSFFVNSDMFQFFKEDAQEKRKAKTPEAMPHFEENADDVDFSDDPIQFEDGATEEE